MPGTLLFVKRRQLSIPQLQLHGVRRTLCSEEFSRDVESFASNYDDFLAVEQLLGYSASQAAQEMSLAINDDLHGPAISTYLFTCNDARFADWGFTYDRLESRHPGRSLEEADGILREWGSSRSP